MNEDIIQAPMSDTSPASKATFAISPRKAGIFLGIVAIIMSTLAIIGDLLELKLDSGRDGSSALWLWPFARQFNFVEEGNLANFYQGTQLVLAAVILLIIWRGKKQAGGAFRGHWLALGLIFVFLGCDEVAQIHETTIANTVSLLRHRLTGHDPDGKTEWLFLYLPLLAVFGLSYISFLKHLPGRIAVLMMVSGCIYVGGAVGVEKFVNWFAEKYGDDTVSYVLIDNLGEFMESTGIALFIYTLLSYLALQAGEISFRFPKDEGNAKHSALAGREQVRHQHR